MDSSALPPLSGPAKKPKRREKEDPNNTWNMQFMAASKAGNRELMAELLEKGAVVDHVVREGVAEETTLNTPFTAAVRAGSIEMFRHLASLGADVNFEMERRTTAVHYAVQHDFVEVAEALMQLKPDTTKKNELGHTAVQLAIFSNKVEMAHLLLKNGAFHDFRYRGAGPYTLTQQACISGDLGLLEALLELGDSVHQRDSHGNTLVHLAAEHQRHNIIEELVVRRANLGATNAAGLTPLAACVDRGGPGERRVGKERRSPVCPLPLKKKRSTSVESSTRQSSQSSTRSDDCRRVQV
eukprot:RCo016346